MAGLMFPVVCAALISKEVSAAFTPFEPLWPQTNTNPWRHYQIMDRFINDNGVDADEWNLVLVDSIDDYYDEASLAPMDDDSDSNSPFIGKTPQECHQMLLQLRNDTESEIMTDYFAIMDERSTKDDTVLLVTAERDLGGENEVLALPTVRATFQASALALMLYETGHSSVEEDADRAKHEKDNVYRGR